MKVLILAGGMGTRLGEETHLKPKPMVEIGGQPILWHIMKIYSSYGFNDFIILCGYKQEIIKQWFVDYYTNHSDILVDMKNNNIAIHQTACEPWKVTLMDTGLNTMTGSRVLRAKKYIGNEPFMLTYGDGVSDVNIDELLAHHKKSGLLCTMTAIQPAGRFGVLELGDNDIITNFVEKPRGEGGWINGGFFVCEPEVLDYIPTDKNVMWEAEPLKGLMQDGQLNAYKHNGFWQPMDMLRDKELLNKLWDNGTAPWKKWSD